MKPHAHSPSLDLFFRALADPTRLRILNLIADREICVCYFVDVLKNSQPKISRHLAYLRRTGIVAAGRHGRWMYYRLAQPKDDAVAAIMKETLRSLRKMPEMQADLAKLETRCCGESSTGSPRQAPQPLIVPTIASRLDDSN